MCQSNEEKSKEICSQLALYLMESALKKISPAYVRYYQFIDKNGNSKEYEPPERYFASELYYQLKTIAVNSKIFGANIIVDAEVPKRGYPVENKNATCESDKTSYVLPDLVIHGGLTDYDSNNQLLVCEIKRKSGITEDAVINDLKKLGWYIKCLWYENKQVGFGAGCFVVMNYSKEELYSYVKNILNNNNRDVIFVGEYEKEKRLSDIANKITFFSYNVGKENKPEIDKFILSKVFDDLKKKDNSKL